MTDAITTINRVALETQDNGPKQDIKTIVEYLAGESRDDAEITKSQVVPTETTDSQIIEQSAKDAVGSHMMVAGYETTIAVIGKTDAGAPEMGVLAENTGDGHVIGTIRMTDIEGLVDRLRDIETEVVAHNDGLELMG